MLVSFAVDDGEILQGGTLLKSMPDFLAPLPFFLPQTPETSDLSRCGGVATWGISTLTRAQEMDETIS